MGNWSETQNVNELSIESTVVVFVLLLFSLVFFGFLWFSLVYFGFLWFTLITLVTLVASKLLPNSHSPLTGSWHFAS